MSGQAQTETAPPMHLVRKTGTAHEVIYDGTLIGYVIDAATLLKSQGLKGVPPRWVIADVGATHLGDPCGYSTRAAALDALLDHLARRRP